MKVDQALNVIINSWIAFEIAAFGPLSRKQRVMLCVKNKECQKGKERTLIRGLVTAAERKQPLN
jgi:hypothetical protein